MPNKNLTKIVEELAQHLISLNIKLVVAESCTGGWIAKVLTDLPGSSNWFDRGFVTYSNQAKQEMIGVAESTLEAFGAVSEETAKEMAVGAIKHSAADVSLSVTGIAGPTGGSSNKPVGLVWFAWANKEGSIASENKIFRGDRNAVREQTVEYALKRLIQNL